MKPDFQERVSRISFPISFPRLRRAFTTLSVSVLLLAGLAPAVGFARTYVVTDYLDDDVVNGTCTLREALRAANQNAAVDACPAGQSGVRDVIQLAAGTHVVDLSTGANEDLAVTGDLDIRGSVEIRGASREFTVIDGSGPSTSDRLFHIHDFGSQVSIEDVALRGGNAIDSLNKDGGVLSNLESTGSVELIDVEVSGGFAGRGGGIYNAGNLTLRRSRVIANRTPTTSPGVTSNSGGGIYTIASIAQLRVEDSEIVDNQAYFGGGLGVNINGFKLYRSSVTGNVATVSGGGVFVGGESSDFEMDYVDISGNRALRGGGVFAQGTGEIQHSAFIANQATETGGGFNDSSPGTFVRFSTFAENSAPSGGAVYAFSGQTLLDSDTIVGNTGGGVHNGQGVFFENTLLAQNSGGSCTGAAPAFGAFNLEHGNTCGFVSSAGSPNFPNTDPLLEPLRYNGGPTRTIALRPGSPAIDAVSSEIRTNCQNMLDQRGHPRGRPRIQAAGGDVFLCDIGAFERTTPFVVDSAFDSPDADPEDDLCADGAGLCSLRAAVQQSRATPGRDEIVLGPGTFSLSIPGRGEDLAATGDLDIAPPVEIRGAGSGLSVVDAQRVDRAFDVGPGSTPSNAPNTTEFKDLTITGGDALLERGGGIAARRDVRLERVVLTDNLAERGSAISSMATGSFGSSQGFVELVDSTVTRNPGGGALYITEARVERSSLVDNDASSFSHGGAGELIRLELVDSTVSGNSSDGTGAIFASQAIIDSSTIFENQSASGFDPGGLFLLELSAFHNSIVADNVSGSTFSNCALNPDAAVSLGFNLTNSTNGDCGLIHVSDLVGTNPDLGPLGDHGGPTPTHLPDAGSAAIDQGDESACPHNDQRGAIRPVDGDGIGGARCDIGAVEVPEVGLAAGLASGLGALAGVAWRDGRRSENRRGHGSRTGRSRSSAVARAGT